MSNLQGRSLAVVIAVGIAVTWLAEPLFAQPPTLGARNSRSDSLLVRFRSKSSATARASAHAATPAQRVRSFELVPLDVVQVASGSDIDAVAAAYAQRSDVAYVQPNYIYELDAQPNDSKFSQQWALENTGRSGGVVGADIGAVSAWDLTTGDPNVVVGVVDTGIDYEHPDIAANMWTNAAELNGTAGVDDDGNGVVDDIHGATFIDGNGQPTHGNPFDDHEHGTHVAGTIGAVGNNGRGIAGVIHRVRLMAVKAFTANGFATTADVIAATEYAVAMGASVTNNSWGNYHFDQALRETIEAANEAGMLFVAAAGNEAKDTTVERFYPATYDLPNIISVANSDRRDQLSSSSNYGREAIDLAAPGSDILSTVPGGKYDVMSGTSMAAPHVTGVAALLFARIPGIASDEVKALIIDNADHIAALSAFITDGKRLNAANALAAVDPSTGNVRLGRDAYACSAEVSVRLHDQDVAGNGTHQVTLTSAAGDSELVELIELVVPGTFAATLTTTDGPVVSFDGTLSVADGGTITVAYDDDDDGTGSPAISLDTAAVDCIAPVISNVAVTEVTALRAVIELDTSEPTKVQMRFGTACDQLGSVFGTFGEPTSHVLEPRLEPETRYYFVLEATDLAGTVSVDDNAGSCYELTTLFLQDYLTMTGWAGWLKGQTTTFVPDGSGHHYTACRQPATAFPVDPVGGTPSLAPVRPEIDDTPRVVEVDVDGPEQVHLYGNAYDRFWVYRYGWITFDAPDDDNRFSFVNHFAQPRISAFGDFVLDDRGWSSVKHLEDRVAVTFLHIRDTADLESADVQVELFFDGRIRITHLNVLTYASISPVIGLSEGNGVPEEWIPTDLPSLAHCGLAEPVWTPVAGRRLKLKYRKPNAEGVRGFPKRDLNLKLIDDRIVVPEPGSASDPTVNGATLVLFNPDTGERDFFYLPAAYWEAHRNDGYRFTQTRFSGGDPLHWRTIPGPCNKIIVDQGRLTLRCKGTRQHGFWFTPDEPDGQRQLAAYFTMGAGPDSLRYCALFGGDVRRDEVTTAGSRATFLAKKAPAPEECPTLP